MKALTIALSITLLAAIGCRTAKKVQVIADRVGEHVVAQQHLSEREKVAVRAALPPSDPTYPDPAITMDTKYASICPYCDEINLSQTTLNSGGMTVTNGQPITVIGPGGVSTNVVSASDGNIENWSMSFVCRNCRMMYSSYRDQLVPKARSIRLPIRQ